jgi:hypothetical protein
MAGVIFITIERSDILGIIAIIISFVAMITTIIIYDLSEKETHPNLIISSVKYDLPYSNSSNGTFDILTIKPSIIVYNTIRSDYPARILSVKNKIIDDKTGQAIVDNNESLIIGEGTIRIIDSGGTKKFHTEIQMKLNKTGYYKTLTTIEYVDLKDYTLKYIHFYNKFELTEELFENQTIIYRANLKEVGDFNEFWTLGKI